MAIKPIHLRAFFTYALLWVLIAAWFAAPSVSAQQAPPVENQCEAEEIVDLDENGVNDLCETEQVETIEDEQTTPEENDGNVPKGEVSEETVAGTEEVLDEGAVLAETDDKQAVLAETGSVATLSVLVAILLISSTALVYKK